MSLLRIFKKKQNTTKRKRQFGTEKSFAPLPIMHEAPSARKQALSRIAIILTIFFWLSYIFSIIIRQLIDGPGSYDFTLEAFSYTFVVSFLTLSSLVYLITRDGALQRFAKHKRVPRAIIDSFFSKNQPGITVLVPSYSEELSVIRKTILSAVFQEYPNLRVVLLVDDKPYPTNQDDKVRLDKTRNIGNEVKALLSQPYERFTKALENYSTSKNGKVTNHVVKDLVSQYQYAAHWFYEQADKEIIEDHVDEFFTDQVLRAMAIDLETVAQALEMSLDDTTSISSDRAEQLYQRLVWIFTGEVEVFERKKYLSLSHEANKAMNLNSYISLMGGTYKKIETDTGTILEKVDKKGQDTITFADSEFLLTLDADSILLREYCLRLVYLLNQPENEKVAVTQTPYSSFRGAYTRIERLAGATTDIQHVLHQGMTYHGATFWVGANAVIRKAALVDIEETDWERGFEIKRYIQDRTVIEDTESSIDLALHGWSLVNYPERLSYSATPPDFGSLVVQRRRWANGGLIILQKFLSVIRQRKHNNELISRAEILLRVNYLISIAWATFGLIFLLAYPYDGRLLSPLILLAAVPYFLTMASDLRYNGYSAWDVLSIYGFNLILLPVNLAGVLKSIEQAITNKKIPFARTPKVKDRTPAGLFYALTPLLIVAFSLFTVNRNVLVENWGNALFAGFNASVATWAILAYMGTGNVVADIWLGLTDWLYVDVKTKRQVNIQSEARFDWKNVLYQGDTKGVISQ